MLTSIRQQSQPSRSRQGREPENDASIVPVEEDSSEIEAVEAVHTPDHPMSTTPYTTSESPISNSESPPTSPSLPPTRPDTPAPSDCDMASDITSEAVEDDTEIASPVESNMVPNSRSLKPTLNAFSLLADKTKGQLVSSSSKAGKSSVPKKRRMSSPEGGPVGISRSVMYARKTVERIKEGTYQPTEKQIATFEESLRLVHPNAEPRYSPNWEKTEVWCPQCQSLWRTPPGDPLKASAFRQHYKTCTGKPKGTRGRTSAPAKNKAASTKGSRSAHTLDFFATQQGWKRQKTDEPKSLSHHHDSTTTLASVLTTVSESLPHPIEHEPKSTTVAIASTALQSESEHDLINPHSVPCTGITTTVDSRIESYLLRPSDGSGGARSKPKIALELYGKTYSLLNNAQKKQVDLAHQHEKSWRADYELQAVFSAKCLHTAQVHDNTLRVDTLSKKEQAKLRLCSECGDLLKSSRFHAAIKIPLSRVENQKYANKPYRHEKVAQIFARCRGLEEVLSGTNVKVSCTINIRIFVSKLLHCRRTPSMHSSLSLS